jgi:hypothetical protein
LLTVEQFHTLEVGDVVELPALLPGVCEEGMSLAVASKVALGGATALHFDASYFGVSCGTLVAEQNNPGDKIVWKRK